MRLRAVASTRGRRAAHDAALALARERRRACERYVDERRRAGRPAPSRRGRRRPRLLAARCGSARSPSQDLHDDRALGGLVRARRRARGRARRRCSARSTASTSGSATPTSQARVLAMRVEVEAREGGPARRSDAIYRLAALRLACARRRSTRACGLLRTALDIDPQLERAEETLKRALESTRPREAARPLRARRAPARARARPRRRARACVRACRAGDVETVREAVEIAVRIGDAAAGGVAPRAVRRRRADGGEQNVGEPRVGAGRARRAARGGGRRPARRGAEAGAARIAEPDVARQARVRGRAARGGPAGRPARSPPRRTRRSTARPGRPRGVGAARRGLPAAWATRQKLADLLARSSTTSTTSRERAAFASSGCAR